MFSGCGSGRCRYTTATETGWHSEYAEHDARYEPTIGEQAVEDSDRVAESARVAGYRAGAENHHVRVEVSDYRREVPRLLSTLLSEGIHVYSAQVQEPSLEEVFLKLMGEEV